MVYCQECGSEITDVDTFCPFCGINLQPQKAQKVEDSQNVESENYTNPSKVAEGVELSVEMTSDDLNDDSDEIDMSATLVADPSSFNKEAQESKPDSGYLDIKTLKEEKAEEAIENVDKESPEEDSKPSVSEGLDTESTDDKDNSEIKDTLANSDVHSDQDDMDEIMSDVDDDSSDELNMKADSENDAEDNPDPEGFIDSSRLSENSDKEAIEAVIETVKESNEELIEDVENTETASHATLDNAGDKDSDLQQTDDDGFIKTTDLSKDNSISENADSEFNKAENEKIHKTPDEIKTADDSEIDAAVSVIDSKADAWKSNEETNIETEVEKEETDSTDLAGEREISIDMSESTVDHSQEDKTNDNLADESKTEVVVSAVELIKEDKEIDPQVKSVDTLDESIENPAQINTDSVDIEPVKEVASEDKPSENELEQKTVDEKIVQEQAIDEQKPTNDEKVETAGQDVEDKAESIKDEKVNNNDKDESAEVSSQTTPNIGVGDTDGSKSQKLKPLDEGVVLNGRYEIVRKIGGGGMGAVYLANDKNLGGVLRAVKEMVQSYIEPEQQEKAIQDFKRESMLLTSLDHPTIPTIYDYFFDEKEARFYLVMKYISGGDLSARLRSAPEGKLDEISVTDWALQIADVLDYLHNRTPPIVYRDLKPANIMVDGNTDRVMLIDFGIARWINKEEKGVTAVGTMGYAPPELFSGNVEPSSDIYSLGSTMFHLLTGADPQNNPLLIFDFQKHPRPRQINPQLSDQMERILMRSVEYNAEKRFSSAAEMRNSLKEHLENLKAGNVSYGIKETPRPIALSDQPVFCGFCGQKIVATDMFCAFCGAKQPLAQPGVQSQEYHIPTNTAKLVIEGTTELEYKPFDLVKDENLVGRRDPMSNIFPEVDLSKFDPQTKISRKHARIWREGDKFMLEDLGSSNGTIFKPATSEEIRLMPKQTQELNSGDKIQVGDTTLQFMVE